MTGGTECHQSGNRVTPSALLLAPNGMVDFHHAQQGAAAKDLEEGL